MLKPPQSEEVKAEPMEPAESTMGVVTSEQLVIGSIWDGNHGQKNCSIKVGLTPLPNETIEECGRRVIRANVLLKRELEAALDKAYRGD